MKFYLAKTNSTHNKVEKDLNSYHSSSKIIIFSWIIDKHTIVNSLHKISYIFKINVSEFLYYKEFNKYLNLDWIRHWKIQTSFDKIIEKLFQAILGLGRLEDLLRLGNK